MRIAGKLAFEIEDEMYLSRFQELYGEDCARKEMKRCVETINQFEKYFGSAEIELYSVPGRIELAGAHTEHQNGKVLSAAVEEDLLAAAGFAEDQMVRVYSKDQELLEVNPLDLRCEPGDSGTYRGLLKGVLAACRSEGFHVEGFNVYVNRNLPCGKGLAPYAAFEILIGTIVSWFFNKGALTSDQLASIGQKAQNAYFDEPSGMADQLTCAYGGVCWMDFADALDPKTERITLDLEKEKYFVCVTSVYPKLCLFDRTPKESYTSIAKEMYSVASRLGHSTLRNVTLEQLLLDPDFIRDYCGDRAYLRALYFVRENYRVDLEKKELKKEHFSSFLELFQQSGDSSYKYLQNAENGDGTCQELAIALEVSETVLGTSGVCRVQGDGRYGSVVALVKDEAVKRYVTAMKTLFGEENCITTKIRKYGGMRLL